MIKKALLFLLLSLTSLFAQVDLESPLGLSLFVPKNLAPPPAATLIVRETFDTTGGGFSGYDTNFVEMGDAANSNPDYAVSPLQGSQTLRFSSLMDYSFIIKTNLSPMSEFWAEVILQAETLNDSYKIGFNNGATECFSVRFNHTTGTISGYAGAALGLIEGANMHSAGVTYYIMIHGKISSGSNDGKLEVWINTSDSMSGATKDIDISTGDMTTQPTDISLQSGSSGGVLYDDYRLWINASPF